jgi:hypothetical protein
MHCKNGLAFLHSRGRCYDHNFLRFLTIFSEKIGVFLQNQCYDQNFVYFSFVLRQKTPIFPLNFLAKIFKKSKHRSQVTLIVHEKVSFDRLTEDDSDGQEDDERPPPTEARPGVDFMNPFQP